MEEVRKVSYRIMAVMIVGGEGVMMKGSSERSGKI